jgi:hypothetical protein
MPADPARVTRDVRRIKYPRPLTALAELKTWRILKALNAGTMRAMTMSQLFFRYAFLSGAMMISMAKSRMNIIQMRIVAVSVTGVNPQINSIISSASQTNPRMASGRSLQYGR